MNPAEEIITELEDVICIVPKMKQNAQCKQTEQSIQGLQEYIEQSNICFIGV